MKSACETCTLERAAKGRCIDFYTALHSVKESRPLCEWPRSERVETTTSGIRPHGLKACSGCGRCTAILRSHGKCVWLPTEGSMARSEGSFTLSTPSGPCTPSGWPRTGYLCVLWALCVCDNSAQPAASQSMAGIAPEMAVWGTVDIPGPARWTQDSPHCGLPARSGRQWV